MSRLTVKLIGKVSCQVYGVAWHFIKHVTIDWESIVGLMVLPGKKVSLGLWCCLTFHRYVTITCEIDWGIVLASSWFYGVAWRLAIHWNFTITCGIDRGSFSAGSFLHGVAWRYNKHVTIDWKSVVRFMVLLVKKVSLGLWCCLAFYGHITITYEIDWGNCLGKFLSLWCCLTRHWNFTITCGIDWGNVLAGSCLYGVAWHDYWAVSFNDWCSSMEV